MVVDIALGIVLAVAIIAVGLVVLSLVIASWERVVLVLILGGGAVGFVAFGMRSPIAAGCVAIGIIALVAWAVFLRPSEEETAVSDLRDTIARRRSLGYDTAELEEALADASSRAAKKR